MHFRFDNSQVLHNLSGDELAELRVTLQYGIEAVRGVGNRKMDLIILLKLGQIFSKKAQMTSKATERGFLEDRSEALFKSALHMLRKKNSSEPFRRLFKYAEGGSFFAIEQEVNSIAEEAITFLAGRYFSRNQFEDCIEDLAGIKLPYATYFLSESYRKLTEISDTPKKNKRAYLDKAKDYLKQTIDLLDEPNVDRNHPLKSIIDESRKLDTHQSMSDSFVSANGRSDLDESSAHRFDREMNNATPVPESGFANIERMMRQMMASLNILKEDVADVRNRVQCIEERFNKEDEIDDIDVLDEEDYYLSEELRGQNHHLNNTSMMANVSRNQTFNQQTPKSSQIPKNLQMNAQQPMSAYSHQSPMGMNNSFNVNPLLNGIYGQMPMNPYQTALTNAAGQNFPQPSMMPYVNDMYHLQHLAQQLAIDQRNPTLMGFLQQQNQFVQPMGQQSFAMTNPIGSSPITSSVTHVQPATVNAQHTINQNAAAAAQTPPQKQWNTSFKNTPVEKAPPVNVVITSSDPVPQNITTVTNAPSSKFSVTIPPQHIKNNPAAPTFGAALSNPTITAALQDKKSTPFASKPTEASKEVKVTTSATKVPTTQEQKFIFGNLSKPASSTPISSPGLKLTPEVSKSETPSSEPSKPNPFSSLSLTSITPATGKQSKPMFSFGNIGQSMTKSETSSLLNATTPETPSQSYTTANTSAHSVNEDEDNRNYEPNVHFEPVIPLPDLVEVKTGEENEIILFEHRAKLLRYVKETKEWKERGIGNMKVMVKNDDPNKVRLLMRREQVLKICCNQFLAKDTKFNKMPNTETALTWFGQDYSENELQVEMLVIRFKTADICKQFHNAILSAQAKMSDGKVPNTFDSSSKTTRNTIEKPISKPQTETKGFGNQFKPKAGSWSCPACYVTNTEADKKCLSCGEVKDKNAPPEESLKSTIPKSTFSFGNLNLVDKTATTKSTTPSWGDQFKPKSGSWTCKSCYTSNTADSNHCACCEEPKDDTVPKKEKVNSFLPSGKSNSI